MKKSIFRKYVAGSLGLDADGIARIDVPAKYSAEETGVKIQMVPGGEFRENRYGY